jgi:hypothetical protein
MIHYGPFQIPQPRQLGHSSFFSISVVASVLRLTTECRTQQSARDPVDVRAVTAFAGSE